MVEAALQISTNNRQVNQPSKLFPQLFRNCTEGQRVTVLDVGMATPGTVEFFNRFPCKIHFVDLYSAPLMGEMDSEDIDLQEEFSSLLSFPEGTKFDVCLFWDFLNFLSAPAVQAFGTALRPYIHHRSRGHGFGVHNVEVRLQHKQFSIAGIEGFRVTDRRVPDLKFHPHSQTELYDLLGHMDIERGVLLPDGKVEFLLKTSF